ncbi:MAG: ribose 5-phosphate isomerase B [Candidatus Eisenbacteria bacterium]|nr:ribose 5-phosphate isomerase B [Candidatus Eisenbacteria bacterium]
MISERELREVVRRVVEANLATVVSGTTTPVSTVESVPAGPAPTAGAKRLAIGADHGGFEMKERLKPFLADLGWLVDDCGAWNEQPVDYPDIALKVARKIVDGSARLGIIIDGAGIGSAIAANKVPGIRAALCHDTITARNSREHNDANVLTLGGRLIGLVQAQETVRAWLGSECREERHRKRVAMIEAIEQHYCGAPVPR